MKIEIAIHKSKMPIFCSQEGVKTHVNPIILSNLKRKTKLQPTNASKIDIFLLHGSPDRVQHLSLHFHLISIKL